MGKKRKFSKVHSPSSRVNLTLETTGPGILNISVNEFLGILNQYSKPFHIFGHKTKKAFDLNFIKYTIEAGKRLEVYRIGEELLIGAKNDNTWFGTNNPKYVEE